MIMQASSFLKDNPSPTEAEVRVGMEGNLCRCTGYHNIVKAVMAAAGEAGRVEVTAVADEPATEIGAPRKRKEDQRLITGRTRWTDNIQLPGMLHLAMVRSPFAHAKITSIDTDAAKQAEGVVGRHRRRRHRRHPGCLRECLADHARPGHAHPPADGAGARRLRR